MPNGSITVQPSSVDQSTTNVPDAAQALGHGSDSIQPVDLDLSSGSKRVAYFFNFSAVPANASITAVDCQVSATRPTKALKGYSGFILDGQTFEKELLPQKYESWIRTFTLQTQIDRSGLDRLKISVWGEGSSPYRIKYYGSDVTVQYTYNNEQFYVKSGGAWHGATKVYKKVGGVWVEQTTLSTVVEQGVKYKPGAT